MRSVKQIADAVGGITMLAGLCGVREVTAMRWMEENTLPRSAAHLRILVELDHKLAVYGAIRVEAVGVGTDGSESSDSTPEQEKETAEGIRSRILKLQEQELKVAQAENRAPRRTSEIQELEALYQRRLASEMK